MRYLKKREHVCRAFTLSLKRLHREKINFNYLKIFDCVTPASIPQHVETFRSDIYIVMLFDFFFQIKRKVMITFKMLKETFKQK